MKVLIIFSKKFAYTPTIKTIEEAPDVSGDFAHKDVLTAFIQVEEDDVERLKSKEKKLSNLLKWAARNNNTQNVLLHSFAHLSESKAPPEVAAALFDMVEKRLQNGGYTTAQTPFGYFLDLHIEAPGYSMARIFKSL